ncbi:MAG: choice-of-anchor L domain-containing protein [Flavobacteriales bacterium]|nr:choice-of-anchor L domain-containing protein [Flavobacteriales bacterium]
MSAKQRTLPLIALAGFLLAVTPAQAQLIINQTQPPTTLVQNYLMGSGVFANNVTYNGSPGNLVPSLFTTLGQIGRFNGTNTVIGINSGTFLCTNDADYSLPGPNDLLMQHGGGMGGGGFWTSPDLDLSQLTAWPMWQVSGGNNIGNKSVLEFDFVPTSDMVSVRYVFSSEEYERWACSEYNDVFGFFLSGPGINGPYTNNAINIAYVPGSMDPVCVNSVNSGQVLANANGPWNSMDPWENCRDNYPSWLNNVQYYRYNGGQWPFAMPPGGQPQLESPYNNDPYYIQHNGMTVVLTASAAVQCGELYHIKMGVGNTGDNWFPSAVWLENGSFTSSDRFSLTADPGPTVEYTATDTIFYENDCDSVYLRFHRWGGFYLDEWLQIQVEGTATNGVDVLPALIDSVHFNQLDSFAIVPIAVPVDVDGPEDLIIKLITCNGAKIKTYHFLIDQKPPLQVTLDDIDLDCPETITLTPVVTGGGGDPGSYEYLWNTGETTPSITHFVDQTTQFWVQVKDCWSLPAADSAWVTLPLYLPMALLTTPDTAIPCLHTADLMVQAQNGAGGYTYQWTLAGQVLGNDSILPDVPPAIPPVYYVVTVTDLCGVQTSDSVLVSQAPPVPLVLTLTPDTAIPCLGHADLVATVTGGGGSISYTWTLGGQVMGSDSILNVPAAANDVYTMVVSDQCGQSISGQVVVTTGPTPPISIEAYGDTVECAGMTAVLQAVNVSGGGGTYRYDWGLGTGINNSPTLSTAVDSDTWYTLTVTDDCGNSTDTTLAAIVMDHPPLLLATSNDTIVCPGEQVPLWVLPQGGAGGYTVTWPGLGSGNTVAWHATPGGLNAMVQVTDLCGTTATANVQVDVFAGSASISATQMGEYTWNFAAHYEPPGSTLAWDLGDGTTATTPTVNHTYDQPDAFWVLLTVTTPDGCVLTDSVRTRPPQATIYFPNTFTPDEDGFNDTFGGEGILITSYELLVFNRWGQIVFESHDMADRWSGHTPDGEEVPQGIYQYKYRVEGLSLPPRTGFGHITLLR